MLFIISVYFQDIKLHQNPGKPMNSPKSLNPTTPENETNYSSINLSNYKKALSTIKKNWKIILMQDYFLDHNYASPFCILRHDVDFSLLHSVKLAKIEYDQHIQSCFYIHLHSEYYNAFDKPSRDYIKEILSYNHDIGLHFDPQYYENTIQTEYDMLDLIQFEKSQIEKTFDYKINNISFHNPTVIQFDFDLHKDRFCGLFNSYGNKIMKNFKYISDSNGYWRFDTLDHFLNANSSQNIQFLSHPAWWTDEILTPRAKIEQLVHDNANSILQNYDELMKKSGRKNIR